MRNLRPILLLSTLLIMSLQRGFADESFNSYVETVKNVHRLMKSYHYNPKELQHKAYQKLLVETMELLACNFNH